jgi:hypothetical protein
LETIEGAAEVEVTHPMVEVKPVVQQVLEDMETGLSTFTFLFASVSLLCTLKMDEINFFIGIFICEVDMEVLFL